MELGRFVHHLAVSDEQIMLCVFVNGAFEDVGVAAHSVDLGKRLDADVFFQGPENRVRVAVENGF